jgi:hypothetical protein
LITWIDSDGILSGVIESDMPWRDPVLNPEKTAKAGCPFSDREILGHTGADKEIVFWAGRWLATATEREGLKGRPDNEETNA